MFIICVPLGNHITLCTVGMHVGAQNIISFSPSFYALYSSKIPNSGRLRSEGSEAVRPFGPPRCCQYSIPSLNPDADVAQL
jgi:hypothetical protein